MKKILCLIFCLLFASFMLVSCDEEEIGEIPDHYPEINDEIEDVALNMYIIVDSETSSNAIDTVSRAIAQYTLRTYHSEVNVKYVTEEQYATTVLAAVKANDATAANIVLVNSPALMDTLDNTGKLLNLMPYLQDKQFGTLNVQIPQPLLQAATTEDGLLYALPNNHVIGEYTYLVINEEIAKQVLKENPTKLNSYTTYESTEQLRATINAAGYDSNKYVYVQSGTYSLKHELEAGGNVCNVISYPVADAEEAFSSAFAIVDTSELINQRSMEIVYALNNDRELRNLLQYGVSGTNYTHILEGDDIEITMVEAAENKYRMNLIYTGNIFVAAYCDELGWTAELSASGQSQNAESVLVN